MARDQPLPIWLAAMDLALGLEQAAAGVPRVHRGALGAALRRRARHGDLALALIPDSRHRKARMAGLGDLAFHGARS